MSMTKVGQGAVYSMNPGGPYGWFYTPKPFGRRRGPGGVAQELNRYMQAAGVGAPPGPPMAPMGPPIAYPVPSGPIPAMPTLRGYQPSYGVPSSYGGPPSGTSAMPGHTPWENAPNWQAELMMWRGNPGLVPIVPPSPSGQNPVDALYDAFFEALSRRSLYPRANLLSLIYLARKNQLFKTARALGELSYAGALGPAWGPYPSRVPRMTHLDPFGHQL